MTIPLPSSISTASQWQLVDWLSLTQKATAAATGIARVELPALDTGEMWLIDRAVVACTSTTRTTVRIYVGSTTDVPLSGSDSGNFDEAEYPSGLLVKPSQVLIAQWTGAVNGSIATLRLQARQYRRA
jgi:hypothetical protein